MFLNGGGEAVMKLRYAVALASLVLISAFAWSDTLELKNGSVIKGTYTGGSETEISFRVGSSVQQYAIVDVASLKFDARETTATAPKGFATHEPQAPHDTGAVNGEERLSSSHGNSSAASASGSLTVPAGTRLLVRTVDAVDS